MRWDDLRIDAEDERTLPGYRDPAVVRTFDAPEALNTRFYEVRSKSALNRVPKQSQMFFRWTINPYRGCSHACVFCFARPTHTYLDFNARDDFDQEIVVKVNVPERLRVELARPSWKREHVALGTNTDPYQWCEGKYKLMPEIWQAFLDFDTPCSVLTKSPLVTRDVEILKELSVRGLFTAALSIPTLDEKAWRATEPRTPNPRKRIEAVATLAQAGITVSVLMGPLIPGVNDRPEQVEEILRLCAEAGAVNVSGIPLHLRGEVRDIWFDWLRSHRPDLIPHYERLYGSGRGAYMPPSERKRLQALVSDGWRKLEHRSAPPGMRSRGLRPGEPASGASTAAGEECFSDAREMQASLF